MYMLNMKQINQMRQEAIIFKSLNVGIKIIIIIIKIK